MVLIFSAGEYETTTNKVIDWLHFLKIPWKRINGEDFYQGNISLSYQLGRGKAELMLAVENQQIPVSEIKAVWNRRKGKPYSPSFTNLEGKGKEEFLKFSRAEIDATKQSVYQALQPKRWLSHPFSQIEVNKLEILTIAQNAGLNIPRTLVCNTKQKLIDFFDSCNKNLIIKPVGNTTFFPVNGKNYALYTEEITTDFIAQLPDVFIPCLVQEKIQKDVEIRSFVLEESIYSMAIFSQSDKQTKVDFRRYNHEKPNRNVPFKLPDQIEANTIQFMKQAKLNTGSIDFIKDLEGNFFFLEVNPVGQFGMVSGPCNYKLEKKVAEWLAHA